MLPDAIVPLERSPSAAVGTASHRRAVRAVVIGNALEWYEFGIYSLLAVYAGRAFFPEASELTALLAAWASFGVAYLVRPIGGTLLAHLGDVWGRRPALLVSVTLMGIATGLTGLVPAYATIGLIAPAIVVMLRLIQGAAAGGEMALAIVYLRETAAPGRAGRTVRWLAVSTYGASVLGGGMVAALAWLLGPDAMYDWGWRIPLLLALPLLVVVLWMRARAPETPEFRAMGGGHQGIATAIRQNVPGLVTMVSVGMVYNVTAGALLGGYLTHLHLARLSDAPAHLVSTLGIATVVATCLVSGAAIDRLGRRRVLRAGAGLLAVVAFPAFALGSSGNLLLSLAGAVMLGVAAGAIVTPAYLNVAEFFPVQSRAGLGALGYNCATVVGGLTPAGVLLLRQETGITWGFPVVLTATAIIAIVVSSLSMTDSPVSEADE
ncbi:MFS transporter [Demequina aestuarii]|uniref:MFS transporter n=1 Tax=Demequina aestuarii TaxID=327095 RepID=UPI000781CE87|nr:MFS transporter [Demequina aestuarii]